MRHCSRDALFSLGYEDFVRMRPCSRDTLFSFGDEDFVRHLPVFVCFWPTNYLGQGQLPRGSIGSIPELYRPSNDPERSLTIPNHPRQSTIVKNNNNNLFMKLQPIIHIDFSYRYEVGSLGLYLDYDRILIHIFKPKWFMCRSVGFSGHLASN